jgi:hypothetical protein
MKRLAKADADILHKMMIIDVYVPLGLHAQVKAAVPCEVLEHVVEELQRGFNLSHSFAIEVETEGNIRFSRLS